MALSLLEVFSQIPDHRRAEGRRFELGPVLLYSVLALLAGANSYRQMHSFIWVHLKRLNVAFGLNLRRAPAYCSLRLILRGVDPQALEAAFRRHADGLSPARPTGGLRPVAVDGKTLRGSFDGFLDRKAAHMLSAFCVQDRIVLAHVMVDEKSNEIPAAPELIRTLGLTGCLFTLDAEHCQKNFPDDPGERQSSSDAGQGQSARPVAAP
jgi:DDE_Tnp_1-associated